jgi:hypothetical protein
MGLHRSEVVECRDDDRDHAGVLGLIAADGQSAHPALARESGAESGTVPRLLAHGLRNQGGKRLDFALAQRIHPVF